MYPQNRQVYDLLNQSMPHTVKPFCFADTGDHALLKFRPAEKPTGIDSEDSRPKGELSARSFGGGFPTASPHSSVGSLLPAIPLSPPFSAFLLGLEVSIPVKPEFST